MKKILRNKILTCFCSYGFTLSCKSFRSDSSQAKLTQSPAQSSQTKFRNFVAHSCGFTLAEVLITLSILGVVAAISIPNIIHHYKERVLVTQLKKAYAEVSNAVEIARVMNPNIVSFGGGNFRTYVAPFLNVKKDCSGNQTNCMPVNNYKAPYKHQSNSAYCLCNRGGNVDGNYCYMYTFKLILKNDVLLFGYGNSSGNYLYIDVNGAKGPNKYNYDLFEFKFDKDKGLLPLSGLNGSSCPSYTQKVLSENKMDY